MKINDASNGQNKKLAFIDMIIHKNFILTIFHVINFYLRYNDID